METNIVFAKLLPVALMLLSFSATAQTLDEMQKLYPGKTAVFSNVNRDVEISFSKGVPYAKATEVSEMLILDFFRISFAFFSKQKVCSQLFSCIREEMLSISSFSSSQ